MFYSFSVLFFVLGLVTGLPAIFRLYGMEKMRIARLVRSAGQKVIWAGALGRMDHPLIEFQVNHQKHTLEGGCLCRSRISEFGCIEKIFFTQAGERKRYNVKRKVCLSNAKIFESKIPQVHNNQDY